MPYNIDFRRLSHELSHQWFGNSVTCGTWQDIWLNEGFATYFDYLALKLLVSDAAGEDRMMFYHTRAMSNTSSSVYVPEAFANNASRIFNYNLSYCKAAAVIKMLRFELQDDELFWQTLRNYLTEFKNSTATTQDFQTVVEETTGEDYEYFFDQWIYGKGHPIYFGNWEHQGDTLIMRVNQNTTSGTASFFKMLMQYKLNYNGGDTLVLLNQTQRNQVFKLFIPYTIESIEIDPFNETLNEDLGLTFINNGEIVNFTIYPNPFSENIRILMPEEIYKYHILIIDLNGKVVYESTMLKDENIINTDNFRKGIYFLKLISKKNIYEQKLVKY